MTGKLVSAASNCKDCKFWKEHHREASLQLSQRTGQSGSWGECKFDHTGFYIDIPMVMTGGTLEGSTKLHTFESFGCISIQAASRLVLAQTVA